MTHLHSNATIGFSTCGLELRNPPTLALPVLPNEPSPKIEHHLAALAPACIRAIRGQQGVNS